MIKLREPYKKRPIRFLELWNVNDWSMKLYGISYRNEFPREKIISAAKNLAIKILPTPAITDSRYGVGFIGVHDGIDASFVFIDWWANENELNHHVFVASHCNDDKFEYFTPRGLIACCWDLKVLSFERDSWVRAVLDHPNGEPNINQYLQLQLNEDV